MCCLNHQKNLKNLSTLKTMDKSDSAYKTIGEVAKILNLKSNNKGGLSTHVIRFWETQFKQIKPKILNSNRRYYDEKTINLLKKVKFLLKDQGMTINGVKKILNNEDTLKLDEIADKSIRTENLRNKLIKISNKLKELKDGKKKTHVKVRMVPEAKPDSPYFYYVKKPAGGEKAKVKLSAKKNTTLIQENMKCL